jgi:mannose-6-phosphate isomerase-like protein (cupin superfamily)
MPSHQPRRQAEAQISRTWDAIARGIAPEDPESSDPTFIETMRRLRELGEQPRPDPTFADRLEDDLMRAMTSNLALLPPLVTPTDVPNGRLSLISPLTQLPNLRSSRRRWALAQLATAALVLLTLLGSFVALRAPLRFTDPDTRPAIIPAMDDNAMVSAVGTPARERLPSGMADTILMQGTFDALPSKANWAGIQRITLAPGAEWALGKRENEGEGPILYFVESGALTVNADDPIYVTRAGEDHAGPVAPGTDVVLRAGDQGFAPSSVTSRWRNDGSTPVVILDAGITAYTWSRLPDGVTQLQLIGEWPFEPPQPPVMVTLRRVTLQPSDELLVDALPGLELLYVESGRLESVDGDDAKPIYVEIMRRQTVPQPFPAGRIFRGRGSEPVTLLVMTISPTNPLAATPAT